MGEARKGNRIIFADLLKSGGGSSEPLKPLAMGLLVLRQTIRRFKNFKLYLSGFWTYGGNKEVSVGGDHGHGKISAAA